MAQQPLFKAPVRESVAAPAPAPAVSPAPAAAAPEVYAPPPTLYYRCPVCHLGLGFANPITIGDVTCQGCSLAGRGRVVMRIEPATPRPAPVGTTPTDL